MELTTGFIIYLVVFRLSIITAGVVCIVAGYLLFKHGLARREKTEIEGQAGEYRLTIRNAAPGTCFALFGATLIAANFIGGGPGVTMKTLEKVSTIPISEPQNPKTPELLKKNPNELAIRAQPQKEEAHERVNLKAKNRTPPSHIASTEKVSELIMKGGEADTIWELVERAKKYETNQDKANAIKTYEKALSPMGEPMNNLASLYLDAGKNEQAVMLAHLAVTISPYEAGFLHTYAMSLAATGNSQDALQVMEKAASLNPKRYEGELKKLRSNYELP